MKTTYRKQSFVWDLYVCVTVLGVIGIPGCLRVSQKIQVILPVRDSLLGSGSSPVVRVGEFQGQKDRDVELAHRLGAYLDERLPESLREDTKVSDIRPIRQLDGTVDVQPERVSASSGAAGGRVEIVFYLRDVADGHVYHRSTLVQSCASMADADLDAAMTELADQFLAGLASSESVCSLPLARGNSASDRQGRRLALEGDYAGALDCFHQAMDVRPDFHPSVYNAGLMCLAMGRYEESLRYFQRAQSMAEREDYQAAIRIVRPLVEK